MVILGPKVPSATKLVVVDIQNRGQLNDTVPDLDTLARLVSVQVESLGTNCAAPTATLVPGPPNRVPRTLKPFQHMDVYFDVTYSCANDPLRGRGHEDYRYIARVNRAVLDGNLDTDPTNNVCPRNPVIGPDGVVIDPGCGARTPGGKLGADILTDVVVHNGP